MIPDLPPGFWFETVDSTMAEARRLVDAGQIQGTAFVLARHQSAGRGTQGRQWSSPPDAGLYLTIVHLPTESGGFHVTPRYTLAAGVACVEALKLTTGLDTRLKPINDLYVNGRKLAGILVESELTAGGLTCLLTGIGLNLHPYPHALDRATVTPVSLGELLSPEAMAALDLSILVETLVAKVCFWYSLLFQGQTGQVERAWQSHCLPGDAGV